MIDSAHKKTKMNFFLKQLRAITIPVLLATIVLLALVWLKNHNDPLGQDGLPNNGPASFDELAKSNPETTTKANSINLTQALTQGKTSECDLLLSDIQKQNCLDQLTYALTLKQGDLLGCDSISDTELKSRCYDKISYRNALKGHPDFCQSISDVRLKGQCLDETKMLVQTEEGCKNIETYALKVACEQTLQFQLALRNHDIKLCQGLNSIKDQNRCVEAIEQNTAMLAQANSGYLNKQAVAFGDEALKKCESLPLEKISFCKKTLKDPS